MLEREESEMRVNSEPILDILLNRLACGGRGGGVGEGRVSQRVERRVE